MDGRRRVLSRTRVTGILAVLAVVAVDIPLGRLAFQHHTLWAYGLFEALAVAGLAFLGMAILGDDAGSGPDGDPPDDGGYGIGV